MYLQSVHAVGWWNILTMKISSPHQKTLHLLKPVVSEKEGKRESERNKEVGKFLIGQIFIPNFPQLNKLRQQWDVGNGWGWAFVSLTTKRSWQPRTTSKNNCLLSDTHLLQLYINCWDWGRWLTFIFARLEIKFTRNARRWRFVCFSLHFLLFFVSL